MDTQNLADLYELPALDWSSVTDRLDAGCGQAPGSGRARPIARQWHADVGGGATKIR